MSATRWRSWRPTRASTRSRSRCGKVRSWFSLGREAAPGMPSQTGPQGFRVHPDRVLPDRRIIGRTLAALYVFAPLLALIWLATESGARTDTTGIVAVAAIALLAGGVLLTGVFERWPRWTLQVGMALATGLVSAGLYFGGGAGDGVFGCFYLWSA